MNSKNYINVTQDERGDYIYRVMPLRRLFDLFSNRQNVLVRPSKWDDPFENFILNAPARLPDGTIATFGFSNDFYGQCWTRQASSDAIWRIYSPDTKSVRVRTTIRKLLSSLQAPLGEWANELAFIGKVLYLGDKKLIEFGNGIFRDGLHSRALAETLLVKRNAFKHEREVRLLCLEKDEGLQDICAYPLDPHALIDQIMVDPRLPFAEVEKVREDIRKRTGFAGRIKRSLLYAPPSGMIFPIG